MQITEQTYRDFRLFYRGLKNDWNRNITPMQAAYDYSFRTWKDLTTDSRRTVIAYLVNGPRCDGDVLTIHQEGLVDDYAFERNEDEHDCRVYEEAGRPQY